MPDWLIILLIYFACGVVHYYFTCHRREAKDWKLFLLSLFFWIVIFNEQMKRANKDMTFKTLQQKGYISADGEWDEKLSSLDKQKILRSYGYDYNPGKRV